MPYMQSRGDYLGGGYQRGDPGLFGFLGGVAKRVFKHVVGGGIAGEVVRATGAVITTRGESLPAAGSVPGPAGFGTAQIPAGQVSRGTPHTQAPGTGQPGCARGYHLAKDGSGRWVKNRTMNVANPKALRRAIRRESGFVKLAQRSLKGTGYKITRR